MYITAGTLDDLLGHIYDRLLKSSHKVRPTRGEARELNGVLLKLRDPRARLSRTEMRGRLFSSIGELLWYLSKSNKLRFIQYYIPEYEKNSEDKETIYGGYGPRLFNFKGNDQVRNVLQLLRKRPPSRRAVIQLFDAVDLDRERIEIPCTCTVQFMIRHGRLHMFTNMRSNDAFIGLPHDVFAFTMLQEIFARSLGVELGTYKQAVGSLHLYETNVTNAQKYLSEGVQSTVSMPPMPMEDPWPSLGIVLKAESEIRHGKKVDARKLLVDRYWQDIIRLLQIFAFSKSGQNHAITRLKRKMSTRIYDVYIEKRRHVGNKRKSFDAPIQEKLL